MNAAFLFVAAIFVIGLVLLLFWALRGASLRKGGKEGLGIIEQAPRHVSNMVQIRQALDQADLQFAAAQSGQALAARLRRVHGQPGFGRPQERSHYRNLRDEVRRRVGAGASRRIVDRESEQS